MSQNKQPFDNEFAAAAAALTASVAEMLSQRELFEKRAREWLISPAFEKVYGELHEGLLIKTILTVMRKGHFMKMRSAKLREGYRRLATEGELLFAGMVIGNTRISEDLSRRCPVAVVASRKQDVDSVVHAALLGEMIAEAYMEGGSKTMPECARIIANDSYRALRRQVLPVRETQRLPAALFDIRISMNELVGDGESCPFVPLMVHPGGGPFAVVPWPVLHGKPVPTRKSLPPPIPQGPSSSPKRPPPIPEAQADVTPGGSKVLRHKPSAHEFQLAVGGPDIQVIEAHVEKHIGAVSHVFHEIISDQVHLDVHFVPPTPDRPFHTLVTSGMSDRPMTVPSGAEEFRHAELMICLPAEWKLAQSQMGEVGPADFNDERNYWPVRWLKKLARLPHEYDTWIGPSHTIPNGDPAEPLAIGLPFTGFLVFHPAMVPDGFHRLCVSDEKTINFYAIIPITTNEMDFKLQHGAAALLQRLMEHGVTELVNPLRAEVV
ncbi:suppressor of fused domain protein [Prosthecobacter sp.]|uniref:suppressor of fused domain protein n=1 Tax=Prosthecobacter sp. TaxID=1965333 RepID=UPI0025CFA99D|nr:suppressor of fused domain protein [Prosthecobacter sp.]